MRPSRTVTAVATHRVRLWQAALTVLLLSACSVPGGSRTPSVSPRIETSAATPSPAATPTPSPSPFTLATDFTSPIYGYTVTLPPGWTVFAATSKWDGATAIGHDDPIVDQLVGPEVTGRCTTVFVCGPVAWAYAAATRQSLADYVKARDAADDRDHACPPPVRQEQITIAGQPALLETGYCPEGGILVLRAVTIHAGTALSFFLQDPANERAVDPLDRADFLALLKSVRLAG